MVDAISVALSGLRAQGQRVAVASNNIANAATAGRLPTAQNPQSGVYTPLTVNLTAQGNGGVSTTVVESPDGYSAVYDPSSVYANEEGLIAAPNVDLAQESVTLLEARTAFKANLAVLKTEKEMLGELMDVLA